MSRHDALEGRLAQTLAEVLHVDLPSAETDLIRTGRLDSVGLVDLLLRLERHYGVRVDMEDLEVDHFRSLRSITAFVAARMELRGDAHSATSR